MPARSKRRLVASACLCLLMLITDMAAAETTSPAGRTVVASVGGRPIYSSDVARLLAEAAGGHDVAPAALPLVQAQLLEEIINRYLVLAYAQRNNSGAEPAEVEVAIGRLKSTLAAQGRSLEDYLKEQSMTESDLRHRVTWKLVWEGYLARYLTDERIQAYFQAHRRQFDGTELSVSQILLKNESAAGTAAREELLVKAEAIRRPIVAGELSFAEAAKRYSAAPSAADGGKLGCIARHGAMDEAFSRAAFELEVGQVSGPVQTRFGVHLIRCDQLKPGNEQLTDVREQVAEALARELLEKLARLERQHTPVEFTGAAPYFRPGTRQVVVP